MWFQDINYICARLVYKINHDYVPNNFILCGDGMPSYEFADNGWYDMNNREKTAYLRRCRLNRIVSATGDIKDGYFEWLDKIGIFDEDDYRDELTSYEWYMNGLIKMWQDDYSKCIKVIKSFKQANKLWYELITPSFQLTITAIPNHLSTV